jgi:hypothetical protein
MSLVRRLAMAGLILAALTAFAAFALGAPAGPSTSGARSRLAPPAGSPR